MSKKYKELEDHIINIFESQGCFSHNGKNYNIIMAGKPRPSSGECKTDVYVLLEDNDHKTHELKISVKRSSNNEFQENKVTAEKAEAYFGSIWADVIYKASYSIKDKFEQRPLIYQSGKHPTKPNSITLGWKLEIASKARELSVKAPLSDQAIREYVFKGSNQTEIKKNSCINGQVVQDSGVATHLLSTEKAYIHNIDDILHQMKLIDFMELPDIYLIFTANNYRTDEDSADGKRPLAVYINWSCINGKLTPDFIYNKPLDYTGEGDIKPILLAALNKLGKFHPINFDISTDVCCPKIILP